MIRTTRWQPDTHSVAIEYEWDDTVPEEQRVHTPVRAWTRSTVAGQAVELPHPDPAALHAKVLAENRRKNMALQLIADNAPVALTKPELDSDGDPTGRRVLKDKHLPAWALDKDGNVSVTIPGATNAHKAALRGGLAAKFGSLVTLTD